MNINEIYSSNSEYLRADDIKGQKPVVTIEGITTSTNRDKRTGEEYTQLVLTFVGKEKKLSLNRTNAQMIAELTGSDNTDDWIGVSLKLYTTLVTVGDEKKLGIRIMPELPEQKAPPKADFTGKRGSDPDDDDSFAF